jgi:hypothetical protein
LCAPWGWSFLASASEVNRVLQSYRLCGGGTQLGVSHLWVGVLGGFEEQRLG